MSLIQYNRHYWCRCVSGQIFHGYYPVRDKFLLWLKGDLRKERDYEEEKQDIAEADRCVWFKFRQICKEAFKTPMCKILWFMVLSLWSLVLRMMDVSSFVFDFFYQHIYIAVWLPIWVVLILDLTCSHTQTRRYWSQTVLRSLFCTKTGQNSDGEEWLPS